jgi:O-antigen ligase
LPTPVKEDHVRFSISIVLFIMWCIYSWPQITSRGVRWFIGICIGLFIVYMHILAAKSGLLALYLFLFAFGLYISFVKKKIIGFFIIIAIPVTFFLALNFLPTLAERKAYIYYSVMVLIAGDRSGNYGDIGRLMSYKLALNVIKDHPIGGVGAGDIMTEMKKGYVQFYPEVDEKAQLLPHNQFLIMALGAGIPSAAIFAIWALMPLALLRRNKESFYLFITWLILFIQLAIEPVLEVQMGVWVFMFFLVFMIQQLPEPKPVK